MQETTLNLTTNEVLVLQQINEDGEEDMQTLSQELGISHNYLSTIVSSLKHKGLIMIDMTYQQLWVRPTAKGRHFVTTLWPEAYAIGA